MPRPSGKGEKGSHLKAEEKAPRGPLGEIAVCPQQLEFKRAEVGLGNR